MSAPLLQQLWEADPTVNKCEYWISGEGWDTEKAREDWNALLLELEYLLHAEVRDTEKVPPPQIQWLLTADPSSLAGSGGEELLLDVLEPCLSEESVSDGALVALANAEAWFAVEDSLDASQNCRCNVVRQRPAQGRVDGCTLDCGF